MWPSASKPRVASMHSSGASADNSRPQSSAYSTGSPAQGESTPVQEKRPSLLNIDEESKHKAVCTVRSHDPLASILRQRSSADRQIPPCEADCQPMASPSKRLVQRLRRSTPPQIQRLVYLRARTGFTGPCRSGTENKCPGGFYYVDRDGENYTVIFASGTDGVALAQWSPVTDSHLFSGHCIVSVQHREKVSICRIGSKRTSALGVAR